jgi:hypothetical protein
MRLPGLAAVRPLTTSALACCSAGEIGPPDGAAPNAPSAGVGWHIMVTILGR